MFRVVTIGGYGFTEERFGEALETEGVDTFVDIRQRRGVRGATYSFLNSRRLQRLLAGRSIRYVHLRDLAPTSEIRAIQQTNDARSNTSKKQRSSLSHDFRSKYEATILGEFSAASFLNVVGESANTVALFCVETLPSACHRSLVASWLSDSMGVTVKHVVP